MIVSKQQLHDCPPWRLTCFTSAPSSGLAQCQLTVLFLCCILWLNSFSDSSLSSRKHIYPTVETRIYLAVMQFFKKKHCFYSPYPIPIDIFGNRFTYMAHSLHFLTRCGCLLLPEQNSMNTTRHVIMLFYTLWRPFVLFRSLYTVVCCFFVCSRGHGGWAEPWRLYTAHLTNGPALCTCSC